MYVRYLRQLCPRHIGHETYVVSRRNHSLITVFASVLLLSACVSQQPTLELTNVSQQASSSGVILAQGSSASSETSFENENTEVDSGRAEIGAAENAEEGSSTIAIPKQSPRAVASSQQEPVQSATKIGSNANANSNKLAIAEGLEGNVQNRSVLKAALAEPANDAGGAVSSASVTDNRPTIPKSEIQRPKRTFSLFKQRRVKPAKPIRIAKRTKPVKRKRASLSLLPGVKSNAELFGIKEAEKSSEATVVASAGSFGRLSPNGLRLQHSKVQVACLKPGVLRILKIVEKRYRSKPIITSGYRSPKRNRRAGGSRNSMHIFCKAVDIQVEGVTKWQLAKFLRTIPGRGGVGTYCRTKSVHIDIGTKRDWHHPCRRSSVRKRKRA